MARTSEKLTSPKPLYLDEQIAVIQAMNAQTINLDLVLNFLLSLDTKSNKFKEKVKSNLTVLASFLCQPGVNPLMINEIKNQEIEETENKKFEKEADLSSNFFEKREACLSTGHSGNISKALAFHDALAAIDEEEKSTRVINLPYTQLAIKVIVEGLQFLANLYLLMSGDERKADMLPELDSYSVIDEESDEVATTITLPWFFIDSLQTTTNDPRLWFDESTIQTVENEKLFSVTTKTWSYLLEESAEKELVDRKFYEGLKQGQLIDPMKYGSPTAFDYKRAFAIELLVTLLNHTARNPFAHNSDLKLHSNKQPSLTTLLGEYMEQGKLQPCPHCGRPVLLLQNTSTHFCKDSHRIRYNEKAHAMFDECQNVQAVIEAYPYISEKTIRSWEPKSLTSNERE